MYGEAGNELLSDQAAIVWMTLPDDVRIHKVSSLISGLEQSVALMAEFIIEKQKKVEYSNWGKFLRKEMIVFHAHFFSKSFKSESIWKYWSGISYDVNSD